jgi:hypothetical protein
MEKYISLDFLKKQKHCLLFFAICILSQQTKAQTPQFDWVQNSYTTFRSNANNVAADNQGNVFYAGEFLGPVDFDPSPSNVTLTNNYSTLVNNNGYIAKLDSNGNLLWAHSILTDIQVFLHDMKLDAQGNIYIMGSAINFIPNLYYNNDTLDSIFGDFFMKMDNDGNLIWVKTLDYQGSFPPIFNSFVIDVLDNIYLTGNFIDTVDFNFDTGVNNLYASDVSNFVLKINTNGDFIWVKNIGLSINFVFSNTSFIEVNLDGIDAFYILGKNAPGCDIDPDTSTYILNNIGNFIAKFDSAGHFLWVNQYNNINPNYTAINTNGEVYCIGYFLGTVDFDADTATYFKTAVGNIDIFMLKLSANGVLDWVKTIGSAQDDLGLYIQLQNDQSIIISGVFSENINFGDTFNPIILSSQGKKDIFVAKLNENGITSWAKSFGGSEIDYNLALSLDQENILLSGAFYNTVDFDFGPATHQISSNAGSITGELYVLKINQTINMLQSSDTLTICEADSILLNSGYTTGNLWNTGDTTQYLSVATNGVYYASINNGSIYTDTTTVIIIPSNNFTPFSLNTNDTLVCIGSQVEISAPISSNSYLWDVNGSIISSSDSLISVSVDSTLNVLCYIPNSDVCPMPISSANQSIQLNHFPITTVSYNAPQGSNWICANDPAFALTGGLPVGGNYLGAAVSNGVFTPNSSLPNFNFVNYTYIDTNFCSVQALDTIFVTVCTDINSNVNDNIFQLYPIPAQDYIFIQLAQNKTNGELKVTSVTGNVIFQTLLTKNLNEINISDLSTGMYIVTLNYDGKELYSKFIKY